MVYLTVPGTNPVLNNVWLITLPLPLLKPVMAPEIREAVHVKVVQG
jgi:hypothetical protein